MTRNPDSYFDRMIRRFDIPPISQAAAIGLMITGLTILLAIVGPWISPFELNKLVGASYGGPTNAFVLGTDIAGRDTLSRLIYGARLTVCVSVVATLLAYVFGFFLGFLAAEIGGWFDTIIAWLVDIMLSIPSFLWVLLVVASLDPNLTVLVGAIATAQIASIIRVSRSLAINIVALEFVESARAQRQSVFSIIWREILPNTIRPLSADFGLRLNFSIILLSSVSFLGLGVQPPEADWGSLIRENLTGLQTPGYLSVLAPAIAVGVLSVAINLVVDWLQSSNEWQIPEELAK